MDHFVWGNLVALNEVLDLHTGSQHVCIYRANVHLQIKARDVLVVGCILHRITGLLKHILHKGLELMIRQII